MNIEDLREYCLSFPHTSEGLPFDETTLVFKVVDKIFCLADLETFEMINVKCDPEEAVLLREEYRAVLPGYHSNKRHWNSLIMDGSLPDHLIKEWVKNSYDLVVKGMTKKMQTKIFEG